VTPWKHLQCRKLKKRRDQEEARGSDVHSAEEAPRYPPNGNKKPPPPNYLGLFVDLQSMRSVSEKENVKVS
jgi:hypothetical protein